MFGNFPNQTSYGDLPLIVQEPVQFKMYAASVQKYFSNPFAANMDLTASINVLFSLSADAFWVDATVL